MARGMYLMAGVGLVALAASALLLNFVSPYWACRLGLCPDSVALSEAGRFRMSGSPDSARQALNLYRHIIRRNPASAYRWCDLGDAYLAVGEVLQAQAAFEQGERLAPAAPQILLRVAGFYLRQREYNSAVRRFSRILSLTPAYDHLIFSYYERLGLPLDSILGKGVPPEARPAQSYFQYLLSHTDPPKVSKVWTWLGTHGFQDDVLTSDYINYLLRNKRPEEAAEAWARYLGPRAGEYPEANRIYNGSFERDFLPSPFDWRLLKADGARAVRERSTACAGDWSLRIDFRGTENLAFQHVSQIVFVKPGRYRFQICMKSEHLTTDQGVGIRIRYYEASGDEEWSTERLLGSTPWRRLTADLAVPPATRLLLVEVVRDRSMKFDSLIAGTVWLDDVRLEPLAD